MVRDRFLSPQEIEELKAQEMTLSQAEERLPRTPEQIEAIYSNGTNVLVSASAGSGKTFVMVERIIDMLKRGVNISQLFISTFTVKAAGELKERIEDKLIKEIAKTQDQALKQHLSAQLGDIQNADIGTMDAFAQKLVNTYGYSLGVSPNFRIMQDKSEQDILKNEVYGDLFTSYMTGPDSHIFKQTVRNFTGQGKDSTGFRQVVYAVHAFSQSTADPKAWLEETFLKSYQVDFDQQVDAYLAPFLQEQDFGKILDQAQGFFRDHLSAVRGQFKKSYKYLANVENLLEALANVNLQAPLDQLQEQLQAVKAITSISRGLTMSIGSCKDESLKAFATDYNQERPNYLAPILDLERALSTVEALRIYQPQALPLLKVLQAFVLDFSAQYLERKKQENAFEFSDIAHLAIEILETDEPIRQLYQDKYHEVMVDEYQDNNHMQERLLDLLSNGHNRFMVGDIKQSIYRFRQADPMIFQAKFQVYDRSEDFQIGKSQGLLIILKENFRSHLEVLAATNAVFARLMDQAVGEITYDQSHFLVAGHAQKAQPAPANRTQVFIYDQGQKEEQESSLGGESTLPELSVGEVKLVVKEIIRLHQEEGVPFDDITLLVPTRTRNDQILATFEQYGVPLVAESGTGHYLKSLEILVMLDTLRTINNPLQDQSLLALLKSPMFHFGEDLLTRISLQAKRGNFYDKLLLSLNRTGDHPDLLTPKLYEQVETFNQVLKSWRTFARTNSLHDLIWKIYNDKFYYDYVGALANGQQRQANLYTLTLRAHQFEKTGFKGLPRFINMIDQIIATDNDLADVEVALPKNAVQLMTAHKSKGLEFPYVFLLNLDKTFNQQDQRSRVILSRHNGVGIQYVADLAERFPEAKFDHVKVAMETLPYQINQRQLHRAMLSEQMRLLYVAMTRAETKLYLVGKGSQEKLADRYQGNRDQERLSIAGRETWTSFQDWFLALKQNFPEDDLGFDLSFISDQDLEEMGSLEPNLPMDVDDQTHNRQSETISQALEALENVEKLNQQYAAAINLPTVRTPSQIKKFYQPLMDEEGMDIMEKRTITPKFDLPSFGKQNQVTGAAIGSATHELMQRIPLKETLSLTDLQVALAQVQAEPAVKKRIDLKKIAHFFQQEALGQEIIAESDKVVREAPFAMLYKDRDSQEEMVIRGIVDGFIRYEDHIVLFDYKTDSYQNPTDLVHRYQGQMDLYAKALRDSFRIQQVDKYLVCLGGKEVVVQAL
ncbi:exonuclease RexA [Streptococcus criceti]|uniref:ATP-dependent helicase/nuclease subunit A n=2 Tax=Streptococcus criceti TaxID=1333 RepID=G5JTU2_STRCG|nr:helicase-exonuclease AddAB subunit AddA [Streptococcus criceti]EHI74439.1 ATP-dependent helicase/nuclease subunit A family protein [Streptococcus criceti HS-6]SUN37758.1 exonuclease RexA [Streptococcus criceti]